MRLLAFFVMQKVQHTKGRKTKCEASERIHEQTTEANNFKIHIHVVCRQWLVCCVLCTHWTAEKIQRRIESKKPNILFDYYCWFATHKQSNNKYMRYCKAKNSGKNGNNNISIYPSPSIFMSPLMSKNHYRLKRIEKRQYENWT